MNIRDLQNSQEFLNIVLDQINSAIFVVDQDHVIKSFNNALAKLFKIEEKEIIDQLLGNALGCVFTVQENKKCMTTQNCSHCEIRKAVSGVMRNSPTPRQILTREFQIDGQYVLKHFYFMVQPVKYKDQNMAIIIMDDLTELEEKKAHLEKLNELKNKFLGIAAHDLRNPISIINMYSASIMKYFNTNLTNEQVDFISIIHRTSVFMLSLVDDFLDISTIEAGQLILKIEPHDYQAMVSEIVRLNRIIARNKEITLVFEPGPSFSHVYLDSRRIEQVLNNLISNAIKYSPPGATIRVTLEATEKEVITCVCDQGPGIPAAELTGIFDEFYRPSTVSTAGEKQTGLGLAIARKIVKAHDGTIGVSSEENAGSRFYFTLPLHRNAGNI